MFLTTKSILCDKNYSLNNIFIKFKYIGKYLEADCLKINYMENKLLK